MHIRRTHCNILFRICTWILLTVSLVFPLSLHAADDDTPEQKRGNLPPVMENTISSLLAAAPGGEIPIAGIRELTRFAAWARSRDAAGLIPQDRTHGKGIFYQEQFRIPLRQLMEYILNPDIPGEILYPNSVRRNIWKPDSSILSQRRTLLETAFPPAAPVSVRGVEEEHTTPDTSSGCHYAYLLNRLFILTSENGRAALIAVSVMPGNSEIGKKGLIVDDALWRYVYSEEQGTNLPMFGWAKTHLYGSASITVYMEDTPGSSLTNISVFKWAKAGWSGMNVVKPGHIQDGVKRFILGFKTVMEAGNRPSTQEITTELTRLRSLDDAALRALLAPESAAVASSSVKGLRKEPYRTLAATGHVSTLSRPELLSEAIKLWMRFRVLNK